MLSRPSSHKGLEAEVSRFSGQNQWSRTLLCHRKLYCTIAMPTAHSAYRVLRGVYPSVPRFLRRPSRHAVSCCDHKPQFDSHQPPTTDRQRQPHICFLPCPSVRRERFTDAKAQIASCSSSASSCPRCHHLHSKATSSYIDLLPALDAAAVPGLYRCKM